MGHDHDKRGGAGTATRAGRRPPPPSRQASIEALLAQTGRGIVPIRRSFTQRGRGATTTPGPLCLFLKTHDDRGLEAYLFAHAMASAAPWDCTLPSGTWVRVLGIGDTASDSSARAGVSKVLRRLEDRKLITRGRSKRRSVATLLREDGQEEPYTRPEGHTRSDRWFQLPHAYWLEHHYRDLSLPAKTMLLIALSLHAGFPMPEERAPDWYGISPDSAGTGLRELIAKKLLHRDVEWVLDHRADNGYTQRNTYTLLGSFSATARAMAAKHGRNTDEEILDLDSLDGTDMMQDAP